MSTLALLAAPLYLRPVAKPDARIAELEAEVDDLKRQCDHWERLTRHWEARYEQAINPVFEQETRAQIRHLAQHHVWLNQAMAQNAQMAAQNFYGPGLHQMGVFNQQAQACMCNCVPARHGFLLGDVP